jgi:hypothetical protein
MPVTIAMLVALDKLLFSCRINNATAGLVALPQALVVFGGHFHMHYERTNRAIRVACTLALLSASALAACTPATPPGATAGADYSEQMTAKVTGVNKARRQVTVQTTDGDSMTIQVADSVQNFDQIQVGDTVRVNYKERVDVRVAGNVQPIDGMIMHASEARAPKGQKPAGVGTVTAERSVQIVSVDKTSHTVTFRESDGSLDSLVVQNPANFAFADGLQPGTIVDVMDTATLAISIDRI